MRAFAEAIQTKGLQREEKGDKKESACRCYTNRRPTEGGEGPQREEKARRGRGRATIEDEEEEEQKKEKEEEA